MLDCVRANGMEPMVTIPTIHHFIHSTVRFRDMLDYVRANGMEPMVTMHHFIHSTLRLQGMLDCVRANSMVTIHHFIHSSFMFRDMLDCVRANGMEPITFRDMLDCVRANGMEPMVTIPTIHHFIHSTVRFRDMLDCVRANGMEPMVTMHHFTHPQWFEELGGFEKEENLHYFIDYGVRLFELFRSQAKMWATFNEPTCFSFVGYICGLWCPGKLLRFKLAGQVLLNLLKAHVEVYKTIKSLPGETILRFFSTGEFEWKAPFCGVLVKYSDPTAPSTLDWWGINYYSHPCLDWWFNMGASKDNEQVSDMNFRVYPQMRRFNMGAR
eukprot:gene12375-15561_t